MHQSHEKKKEKVELKPGRRHICSYATIKRARAIKECEIRSSDNHNFKIIKLKGGGRERRVLPREDDSDGGERCRRGIKELTMTKERE